MVFKEETKNEERMKETGKKKNEGRRKKEGRQKRNPISGKEKRKAHELLSPKLHAHQMLLP